MKKFGLLMLAVLFMAFASVQAANVTFKVNMKVKVQMGEFDPVTQHVRITGTVTDPQWDPANAPILDLIDSVNYVYGTTISLDPGNYLYKYLIGDAWGNDELPGQNRELTVGNDDMVVEVYYNNVEAVPFSPAPEGMVNVMLNVNMTRWIQKGAFDPANDVVRVTGTITDPDWNPAEAPIMEDLDGNYIYTTTVQVEKDSTYEYKYLIGDAWGRDELQGQPNRSLTVAAKDTALFPVYFDNEPYMENPPVSTDSVMLTLHVNMRVQVLEGNFDPANDVVVTAGSFQGWNPAASPAMEDADGDSIYTGVYKVPANARYEYKFVINTDGWESSPNRAVVVDSTDKEVPPVYFNNDSVVTVKKNGNVKFTVNTDVLVEVGLFNPNEDSVHVRGSFNGWNSDDAARSHMNKNLANPLNWFLNVPFEQFGVGDPIYYKFWINKKDNMVNGVAWNDTWERPTHTGGGNRTVYFEGTDNQEVDADYYDHIQPDWVIPVGTGIRVTFNVNMAPAADPNLQPIPFTAGEDTVWWICEQPAFAVTQGWEDTDEMKVLPLTDPDGDMIYSGTLEVKEPAWNGFVYRYAFISESDGKTWQFEPAGFSNFAYRARYVGQNGDRSFPYKDWNMPVDTWTNAELKTEDQESDPYTSLTAIGDAPSIPREFSLNQNYPNPFNPTTTISFTLPEASRVTLSVYNVLGQKVRTLINNQQATAGTHAKQWDGRDEAGRQVASGIYFYKLEAGDFTAIKKMVLMK